MPDTAGQHIQELPPPIHELIACVERLAEIAESNQPPAMKLGQFCTQLAAAMFWTEQIRHVATNAPTPPARGPHWQSTRGRQPKQGSSTRE